MQDKRVYREELLYYLSTVDIKQYQKIKILIFLLEIHYSRVCFYSK